ncbi:MAG: 1,4-alpha-glucan branching protein GlgB, partial [Pirellulaceae bacterium]
MKTDSGQSLFSDFDLHLFGEGLHDHLYNLFGAQLHEVNGQAGINFSVWAPFAESVSVVGDFNNWDATRHSLARLPGCGIWEAFVPGIQAGRLYKFQITDTAGNQVLKSDPFGFAAEVPPQSASVVADLSQYQWSDDEWMDRRRQKNPLTGPVSAYEVHLGSWRKGTQTENGWLNYRDLAHQLVDYCRETGFTHIELLPVSEHPYTGSWGYQTVGYYAVTSRHGTPEDFMYFVDYFHQHGLGVIIDWVPGHFPRDSHGLARFDGTCLYEHEDPRQGAHPDWGTLIFNYGRNEVRNFLTTNAMFWCDKYHIDGLRVDAVASMLYLDYSRDEGQWIPNKYGGRENLEAIEFLKQFNERVHTTFPHVLTIAEESTAWSGVTRPTSHDGLGFSLKWNMGWMNDTLRFMRHEPVHRKYHHDEITFSMMYAWSEKFVLPFSHDEVVHGKGSLIDQMPGDASQKFASLRLLFTYMWTHPGKKLLFMGCEFGQWNEWNWEKEIQWDLLEDPSHRGLQSLVAALNGLFKTQPAMYELDQESSGFQWINCRDYENSVLSWLRKDSQSDRPLIVVGNFTSASHESWHVGVPQPGNYREILNSDSVSFAGSG